MLRYKGFGWKINTKSELEKRLEALIETWKNYDKAEQVSMLQEASPSLAQRFDEVSVVFQASVLQQFKEINEVFRQHPWRPEVAADHIVKGYDQNQRKINCLFLPELNQAEMLTYGSKQLVATLQNPYPREKEKFSDHIEQLVAKLSHNHPGIITANMILELLKKIGQQPKPDHIKLEETHLIAQKKQVRLVVKKLLPTLHSIESVLKLYELVRTKHIAPNCPAENPYAYIRKERSVFRPEYGNTDTWAEIMGAIKLHLHRLAKQHPDEQLSYNQYKRFHGIMQTHRHHGYGFGWMMSTYSEKQYLDLEDAAFAKGEKKPIKDLQKSAQYSKSPQGDKNQDDRDIEMAHRP